MYCIKKDKYSAEDDTICPCMAYLNQFIAPTTPYMPVGSIMQPDMYNRYDNFNMHPLYFNYSSLQMHPNYIPIMYATNPMQSISSSIVPVAVEEIID